MHTLNFSYTPTDIRRIFIAEQRRRNGAWFPALGILILAGVWFSLTPDTQMVGGLALGFVATWGAMFYTSFTAFRRYASFPLSVTLTEEAMLMATQHSRSEIPWSSFAGIHETPAGVGLQFAPLGQVIYLPSAAMTPAAAAFIRQHVSAS